MMLSWLFGALTIFGPWLALLAAYASLRRSAARREAFTRMLRACVRLELPLDAALLNTGGAPPEVARMMDRTARELTQGAPLAVALLGSWACLPGWYVRMVEIGERHGNLADVLDRVLEADSRDEQVRIGLFDRLLYPTFLVCLLGIVALGIAVFILPGIVDMFLEVGVGEAPVTRFLMLAADVLPWLGPAAMLAMLALLALVMPFPWGRNWEETLWPWFWLRYKVLRFMPLFGKRYVRAACGRWAMMVGALLEAGDTLPDAIEEASRIEGDPRFRKAAHHWAERVQAGERLGDVLARTRLVPRSLVWQVQVAEGGEHLPQALRSAGQQQVDLVQRDYSLIVRAATPLVVLLLGLCVGLLAWSLFGSLTEIMYAALE